MNYLFYFSSVLLFSFIPYVRSQTFENIDSELVEVEADPRLFFANFTSSLIQVNSTILAYALIALAVAGAAALALYYLYLESANAGSGQHYGYGQQYGQDSYEYNARSSTEGFGFDAGKILTWIQMASEAYNSLDYKDLECQKKLICEIVREEDTFGNVSRNMKNGIQLAKYLEVLNLPDEMRELLDEYEDAYEVAGGRKECGEVFECNYSLDDSVKRNFYGNSL